jgi:cell division protein FtsB
VTEVAVSYEELYRQAEQALHRAVSEGLVKQAAVEKLSADKAALEKKVAELNGRLDAARAAAPDDAPVFD